MKLRIRNRLLLRTHVIVGSIILVLTGIFSVVFFFGDSENAKAAISGDFRSRQSGNWNGSTSWEKFNGYYWATTSESPDKNDNSISVLSGHTITITSGISVDQLTINAGGTLIASSGNFKVEDGTGVDITVNGTLTLNAKITLEDDAIMELYGTVNKNSSDFDLKDDAEVKVYSGGLFIYTGGSLEDNDGEWHFYNGSTFRHNRNGSSIVEATWASNSTCLIEGSTSSLPGNLNQTFGNFTINTTGLASNKVMGSELDNITGNLTVISTGSGSITMHQSSNNTIVIGGSYNHQGGTLYITEDGDGDVNIGGNMSVSGGVAAASKAGDGCPTYNINGNLTISGGAFDMSQYSGSNSSKGKATINLKGNLSITGGVLKETASGSGKGIVNFTGTTTQTFLNSGTISNTIDAEIKSGAKVDMGTSAFTGSGTFTVSSGATMRIGSTNGITSSGATGAIQVTGTRSYSTTAAYEYNGNSAQVTGNGLPSTVADITFDNTAGVTLTNTVSSKGSVVLTNGVVTTGVKALNVGISTTFIGSISRTSGWVNGNLGRYIPLLSTGTFVFPVGVSTYNEFTAQYTVAPTLGGLLTVSFVEAGPAATGLPLFESNDYKINSIGSKGYWNISPSLGLIGGVYRISVLGNGFTGFSDVANVRVLSRLSSILPWTLLGTHASGTGSISSVLATRSGIGLPQQITLGWGYNALPIELIAFDAKVENQNVRLTWSTAAEINNDFFTLERSEDGRNFDEIGIVRGSGNTTTRRDYEFLDESPLDGESYYRLRQTDYDGKFEVFDPKHISIEKTVLDDSKLTVWPNPFEDHFDFELESEESGLLSVSIVGIDGRTIKTESVQMSAPGLHWTFTDGNNLLRGTYILRIQHNDEVLSRKIIRK